jgi:hypothetical protein
MIQLPEGGSFDERSLVAHIHATGRDYIVQGQTACARDNHPKPSSLDYWLRQHGDEQDTKQANNEVVGALVATGLFRESNSLQCPDSGQTCKGLVLV